MTFTVRCNCCNEEVVLRNEDPFQGEKIQMIPDIYFLMYSREYDLKGIDLYYKNPNLKNNIILR